VLAVSEILKGRLLNAQLAASGNSDKKKFGNIVKPIIARRRFIKTELLFDYPDLVLQVGWMIYRKIKEEPILAYVAGSVKIIPFLTAATLHAVYDGADTIPLIVTPNKGELPYHEMLDRIAHQTGKTKLAYADVSYRTGQTLQETEHMVDRVNKKRAINNRVPFSWGNDCRPIVLVDQWPARATRNNKVSFAGQHVELDVLFDFFDKLQD